MSGLLDLFPDDSYVRVFLGGNVMLMDPKRFSPLGRSHLEILGLRLFFPETENEDWSVNVRIESFGPDPKKVFLQAEAAWHEGETWGTEFADKAVSGVSTDSSRSAEVRLIGFVMNPPASGVDDEEDDK